MITIEQVLSVAEFSPCIRRKYGALIVDTSRFTYVLSTGYNQRVSDCCDGECVRNTLAIKHGTNTDAGAEIHAEQAALVELNFRYEGMAIFVAGLGPDGVPLNGFDNSPCYSCARMIKYAGIEDVYLPVDGEWEQFHIDDIMETWERSWNKSA